MRSKLRCKVNGYLNHFEIADRAGLPPCDLTRVLRVARENNMIWLVMDRGVNRHCLPGYFARVLVNLLRPPEKLNKRITFACGATLARKVDERAENVGLSKSDFIREVVEKEVYFT